MNETITYQVLQEAIFSGAKDFIVCAGSRNSSFVAALRLEKGLNVYYWPEERSAAFFALGRSRQTGLPVAIITTSGTAAAELLPAAMEAYYTGVPLILITADRPKRFRGSNAPQSCEQERLYGVYTPLFQDVTEETPCDLSRWDRRSAVHLNVCLEEPQKQPPFQGQQLSLQAKPKLPWLWDREEAQQALNAFFSRVTRPLIMVGELPVNARDPVVNLLVQLGAPVIVEGTSGLRQDPRLQPLKLWATEKILENAAQEGYPIDGVLRLGGVPTYRVWRDLEYCQGHIDVCSVCERPFSGLSWNDQVLCVELAPFLSSYHPNRSYAGAARQWREVDRAFGSAVHELFIEEPYAEASLFRRLTEVIPHKSHIYLGNSLPIREWNLAAIEQEREWHITASRGLAGIDGQLSTFFGLCQPDRENWIFLGDLTALYDLAGGWAVSQMKDVNVTIVIINNGGGQIFSRMYPYQEMLNEHVLRFEGLAKLWGWDYICWDGMTTGDPLPSSSCRLLEVIPDGAATKRFWEKMTLLRTQYSKVQ